VVGPHSPRVLSGSARHEKAKTLPPGVASCGLRTICTYDRSQLRSSLRQAHGAGSGEPGRRGSIEGRARYDQPEHQHCTLDWCRMRRAERGANLPFAPSRRVGTTFCGYRLAPVLRNFTFRCGMKTRLNHRRQRTPRFRSFCILRQWRGAAAADRSARASFGFAYYRRHSFTVW
jgi:hypothetical protein